MFHYPISQGFSHMGIHLMLFTFSAGEKIILKAPSSATDSSSQGLWNVWPKKRARRTQRHINILNSDVIYPMKDEKIKTEDRFYRSMGWGDLFPHPHICMPPMATLRQGYWHCPHLNAISFLPRSRLVFRKMELKRERGKECSRIRMDDFSAWIPSTV